MLKKLAIVFVFIGAISSVPVIADSLETIKSRGYLKCGVNTALAGFSAPSGEGVWQGLDVDICRAIATSIFDDPNKIEFTALSAQQRFTALQSGEVDILSRNTTHTFQREAALGLVFGQIVYYDGQGFMVKNNSGITSAKQLNRRTVCVQPGTTTELNLADFARNNKITIRPVVIEKFEDSVAAFIAGRCDAYTTDASGLASIRATQKNPADLMILPDIISKEPLGPAVRQGDDKFYLIMNWTVYGLINAEELGVTQANVEQMKSSDNVNIKRLLDSDIAQNLDLDRDFIANVIAAVGNYGEIYERNIGKDTPLGLDRGLNQLWSKGGILYAPPFR